MNATKLKTIAVIAMLIDHVAWAFIPLSSPIAQVMHGIGRLTFPIMAFLIAEGYHHTNNYNDYVKRMGVFAMISHIPYQLFTFGRIPIIHPQSGDGLYEVFATSVIFTFFVSLIILKIYHHPHLSKNMKHPLVAVLTLLTITSDYAIFGPLLVLIYSLYRGNLKQQAFYASLLMIPYLGVYLYKPYNETIFVLAILFSNLLLLQYNGKQGQSKNKWTKYSFYIIYPAHLLILGLLQ